jgi:hypothetical protein
VCDQHQFFFEFDKAFTDQLIKKFEASPPHPLSEDVAPPLKGILALYRHGKLTYAGKALPVSGPTPHALKAAYITNRCMRHPAFFI